MALERVMEPIQIIGIDEIDDEFEKATINKLANEYYEKIQRGIKEFTSVTLHIKKHSKGGKTKKWDMRVRITAPSQILEAQESDWDLAKSLHKVFNNIERELQHKLRVDDQRDKPYS